MSRSKFGGMVMILLGAHGCAAAGVVPVSPATGQVSPPASQQGALREVRDPISRSTSLILEPMDVSGAPGGEVQLGGMFVAAEDGRADGGTALVLRIEHRGAPSILTEGIRLQLVVDGIELEPVGVEAGTLHRRTRTAAGWLETILIPIDPSQLRRAAGASQVGISVASRPPLQLGDQLHQGLRGFVDRLPERALASTASTLQPTS